MDTVKIDELPVIVKSLLDQYDPKKVRQMVIQGFEQKIRSMREDHKKLVSDLAHRTDLTHEERHEKISNSDGKIRSMCWFTENLY